MSQKVTKTTAQPLRWLFGCLVHLGVTRDHGIGDRKKRRLPTLKAGIESDVGA